MLTTRTTLLFLFAALTAIPSYADDWAIQRDREQQRSADLLRQQRETANRNAEFTRQSNQDINRQFEASRRTAQVQQGKIAVELARLNRDDRADQQPRHQSTRAGQKGPSCREKGWTRGEKRIGESAIDRDDGVRHALLSIDLFDEDEGRVGVLLAEFGVAPGKSLQPLNAFSTRQVSLIIGEGCQGSGPLPRCERYFLGLAGELDSVEYVAGSAKGRLSGKLWNGRFFEWDLSSWTPVPHGDCLAVPQLTFAGEYTPRPG